MTRMIEPTRHGVIARSARIEAHRADAAFPGFDCEGKLMRAEVLIDTLDAIARWLARPFRRKTTVTTTTWPAGFELPTPANRNESADRVA